MKRNDEPQINPSKSSPAYGRIPRRASGARSPSATDSRVPQVGAERDRHWPVIVEADGHLGPKTAAPGRNAAFCEAASKPLTQLASPVGVGGTDETRPAPAGAVRIQSELRYDQSLTTDVLEAQVEPPSVVRENPQLGDFVREPLSLLF